MSGYFTYAKSLSFGTFAPLKSGDARGKAEKSFQALFDWWMWQGETLKQEIMKRDAKVRTSKRKRRNV